MTLIKTKDGVYHARLRTVGGKTITISTKKRDRSEAERVMRNARIPEIEEAAAANRLTAEALTRILSGQRISIRAALTQFLEWENRIGKSDALISLYSGMIEQFLSFSKLADSESVSIVTDPLIDGFVNAPGSAKQGTRRIRKIALHQFFSFCKEKGWILRNPAALIRVRMNLLTHAQKEKKARNPFTAAELDKVQALFQVGSFWFTAVSLSRYTGLRLGDCMKIEWDCFSTPGIISVWTDKRDKRVSLEIHPKLQEAIDGVAPVHRRFLHPEAMRRQSNDLSSDFRRYLDKIGIEDKSFHDIRAHYIQTCLDQGIPLRHISRQVAHSDEKTTLGYVNL